MSSVPTMRLVHHEDTPRPVVGIEADSLVQDDLSLRRAILSARQNLIGQQSAAGYWVAELEGDSILQSEPILLWAFLGTEDQPLAHKLAARLLEQQQEDGGWSQYPGGPIDISASVKAYFALKLTGRDPAEPDMQKARAAILEHGGAEKVNSFTRFYLALLGQISYDLCPYVPPEMMLLPRFSPVNIYSMSSWSRTMFVPLSVVTAKRPVRVLSPERGIRELMLNKPEAWAPVSQPESFEGDSPGWERFFRLCDRAMKFVHRRGLLPLRRRALRAAEAWMRERFEDSDGMGAIFPGMVWGQVAFKALGYDEDGSAMTYCRENFDEHVIEEEETARVQPCRSPVWDTAISLRALRESGLGLDDPAVTDAIDWLLSREVRRAGDWSSNVKAEPSGWCFEFQNAFYPDLDDTAMVLIAFREQVAAPNSLDGVPFGLRLVDSEDDRACEASEADDRQQQIQAAAQRAIDWMLAMQNDDGGWGAFDRNNDSKWLCHVPFADHNAMIDPSTPDLTARVVESLAAWGYDESHPAIARAVRYLRETQEADGSWYGRWGVNFIYGTWQTLVGLKAAGVADDDPAVVAGADWLAMYQQENGGWGESPESYVDPAKRASGPTTPSQTAWALSGLIAAGRADHPAVERGIEHLVESQTADGTWEEPEFTGTGFPQVFYLRYHLYPMYFPLLALSQWAASQRGEQPS